jgi:hypothetical protein
MVCYIVTYSTITHKPTQANQIENKPKTHHKNTLSLGWVGTWPWDPPWVLQVPLALHLFLCMSSKDGRLPLVIPTTYQTTIVCTHALCNPFHTQIHQTFSALETSSTSLNTMGEREREQEAKEYLLPWSSLSHPPLYKKWWQILNLTSSSSFNGK